MMNARRARRSLPAAQPTGTLKLVSAANLPPQPGRDAVRRQIATLPIEAAAQEALFAECCRGFAPAPAGPAPGADRVAVLVQETVRRLVEEHLRVRLPGAAFSEAEWAAIRRGIEAPLEFAVYDIRDTAALLEYLRAGTNAVSARIWQSFPAKVREQLAQAKTAREKKTLLAAGFNALIRAGVLFDERLLAGRTLALHTRALLEQKPGGDRQRLLQRRLLQEMLQPYLGKDKCSETLGEYTQTLARQAVSGLSVPELQRLCGEAEVLSEQGITSGKEINGIFERRIFPLFNPLVLELARRSGSGMEARNFAHELWARIWLRWQSPEPVGSLERLLCSRAHYLSLELKRSSGKEVSVPEIEDLCGDDPAEPGEPDKDEDNEAADAEEENESLAIEYFLPQVADEAQRAVLAGRFLYGRSDAELAAAIGKSEDSVRKALQMGRAEVNRLHIEALLTALTADEKPLAMSWFGNAKCIVRRRSAGSLDRSVGGMEALALQEGDRAARTADDFGDDGPVAAALRQTAVHHMRPTLHQIYGKLVKANEAHEMNTRLYLERLETENLTGWEREILARHIEAVRCLSGLTTGECACLRCRASTVLCLRFLNAQRYPLAQVARELRLPLREAALAFEEGMALLKGLVRDTALAVPVTLQTWWLQMLEDGIRQTAEEDRDILRLWLLDRLKFSQIARALRLPVTEARARWERAFPTLAHVMHQRYGFELLPKAEL